MENITAAKEKFGALIEAQKKRVAAMRAQGDFVDYAALPQIVIGVCGGDGGEEPRDDQAHQRVGVEGDVDDEGGEDCAADLFVTYSESSQHWYAFQSVASSTMTWCL